MQTPTKLCSILIPSRRRAERLGKVIKNIVDKTINHNDIEIIIRIDNNDFTYLDQHYFSTEFLNALSNAVGLLPKVVIGPRMRGFDSLHIMYQEMYETAEGKFVLIWNDDAYIETVGWDVKLSEVPDGDFIIQPEILKNGHSEYSFVEGGPFPIVKHWSWYSQEIQCIGNPADTWLDDRLRKTLGYKTHFLYGVKFFHDRDDDAVLNEHRKL